ncbi:MAG TPA: peptidylprolyl isomerase [Bryobacteraceae bacterium]|jgi:parvulin-like peptidyl-prolyl isomerase|nr:peptidylprolyl isomerase [Bryobacteraceae bacterium]
MKSRLFAILAPVLALTLPALAQTPQPAAPKPALGTPAKPATEAAPPQVPENAVVLSVGSEKMTRQQYEDLVKAMPEQTRAQALGPAKRQMAEKLVQAEALALEARKRGIQDRPEVKEITQLQVNSMLAGFLYQDLLESSNPDEAAIKSYYDEHKSDYDEAKMMHILIRYKGSRIPLAKDQKDLTPEEALAKAQEIKKKLDAGGDFAELAKTESDDKGSAAKGGELGEFLNRKQLVPEFANAAFALPVGQVSEPVKTPFGYHIIKVTEKRTKTLEDERAAIVEKLKPEIAAKKAEEIQKQYPVELNDQFFGEKPAPRPTLLTPSSK